MSAVPRNPNLDIVRAVALCMVVLAHAVIMAPNMPVPALKAAWLGQFGVDLFFVLSGWLIGGLFWAEQARFGAVNWPRFVLRRAFRTIPPYFAILPFAWYATHRFSPGHPPFDFHYLFFLQNYLERIPFYAVSWSLCVEEHFYLVLPAVVMLVLALRISPHLLFGLLLLASPLCRTFLESNPSIDTFDRSVLSTHLRMEGLVLGFWAAYITTNRPKLWTHLSGILGKLPTVALVVLLASPAVPARFFYTWGLTILSIVFLVAVVCAAVQPPWKIVAADAVGKLAIMSYSIYLTHSLVIHVARQTAAFAGVWSPALYWPLCLGLIFTVGWFFHRFVEIPCLSARARWLPARVA